MNFLMKHMDMTWNDNHVIYICDIYIYIYMYDIYIYDIYIWYIHMICIYIYIYTYNIYIYAYLYIWYIWYICIYDIYIYICICIYLWYLDMFGLSWLNSLWAFTVLHPTSTKATKVPRQERSSWRGIWDIVLLEWGIPMDSLILCNSHEKHDKPLDDT